jgi:hypothetical protein
MCAREILLSEVTGLEEHGINLRDGFFKIA